MYIADTIHHRIRKVTVSTGIITTIAGSSTSGGYSGDNGAATSATLNRPSGVTVDLSGSSLYVYLNTYVSSQQHYLDNVYIADRYNHRIRKVTVSTGIITTIAGSSTSSSYSGDYDQATSATLNQPIGVALDTAGSTYFIFFSLTFLNDSFLY